MISVSHRSTKGQTVEKYRVVATRQAVQLSDFSFLNDMAISFASVFFLPALYSIVSSAMKTNPPHVAVIGGGAAGLVAARVLSRNAIQVTVLEKSAGVGGVWRYTGEKTHPMYRGLRTNLPKEIMAYRELPWTSGESSYVTHDQVLAYLESYATEFNLYKHIQTEANVYNVELEEGSLSAFSSDADSLPKVKVEWNQLEANHSALFDAVCVCNGHYNLPVMPKIPGIEHFHGDILHSVSYDDPTQFRDKVVLCVGGRASGADIARELVQGGAKHVFLSDTTCKSTETRDKITVVPKTASVNINGNFLFENSCTTEATVDSVAFCTGYDYEFPFLLRDDSMKSSKVPLIKAGQRRVQPLFEQLWHAAYPNVAFLGLPHSVLPFPLFELQAEAFVHQLQQGSLPVLQSRVKSANFDAISGGEGRMPHGRVPTDTHYLGDAQWAYCHRLAKYAGLLHDSDDPMAKEKRNLVQYLATNKVSETTEFNR